MNATTRRFCLPLTLGLLLLGSVVPLLSADQEYSRARIVRLSFVEGTVTLLRPGTTEWASASVNTPIEEGFQLLTDKGSFAEVQFENGSAVRVGELSLLKFDQLGLTESGDELNRITLDRGYGTVTAVLEKTAAFELRSGDTTFNPQGKAEFRVDLDQGHTRVEVFKGSVDVSSPESSTTLAKNEVLEITTEGAQAATVTQGVQRDDWDAWVSERDQQEEQSAATQPPAGTAPGAPVYGWSDLNQYGTWSYVDNCGYGWLPNAASNWSPFGFGQWSTYPGFGYTWISYEPWGWLPYHYGAWQLDPTLGWAWCPGNGFLGAGGFGWPWSPAIVSWYEGPGWIGWAPLGLRPINGTGLHPPRHPVGLNAVNLNTFVKGDAITSRELIAVNEGDGKPVQAPSVQASAAASLPGRPVSLSSAQRTVIDGGWVKPESGFVGRVFRASASGGEWAHRAPQSSFAAPPTAVRSPETSYWSGHAASSPTFSSSGARSGGSFSSSSHGGGFSGGGGGGFSGGTSGGGGHAGGGASAGGGGGGGHH
jgi:hypothetical protein